MVLWRELGGNAVDEKSVVVGIGLWYQEDLRWAKKINPIGSGGILKNHLSCTVAVSKVRLELNSIPFFLRYHMIQAV